MSSLLTSPQWSVLIYRVRDVAYQQKILQAFHRIAWPGITALGTQDAGEYFVIVDCETMLLEQRARRIVMRIDVLATRVLRSRLADSADLP